MLFSSITFLYYFLPLFLIFHYIFPKNKKNYVLLIGSLIFYGWGEPEYVILMLGAILIGYLAGIFIERGHKKCTLWVSITLCLSSLFFFKYADFFLQNINLCLKQEFPMLQVTLPIGISFYTFQVISYIVDVYYGRVKAQKNFFYLAAYISMFPQLIAGPIVRYSDIHSQLQEPCITADNIVVGIKRFVLGLSKKVILANQLGEFCNIFKDSNEKSVVFYWMYGIALMLHYYFDFSGYSDMAIGLGKLLGFHFPENFRYPYMSKSITEFWRRWHISLGTWFRDYVYIPLGGNRKGGKRQVLNICIVWLLTGFWHGANWNFIVWGLYFAVLLIIEKFWFLKRINSRKGLNHIYVLFFVMVSFVIFDSESVATIKSSLAGMFSFGTLPLFSAESIYYLESYGVILLIAFLGATDIPTRWYRKIAEKKPVGKMEGIAEPFVVIFLLLLVTAYLVDGSFNPFLYFRF